MILRWYCATSLRYRPIYYRRHYRWPDCWRLFR
jgi:hypothetical protein